MGNEGLEGAPDVPGYLLPETPKRTAVEPPARDDDPTEWTKEELVREVRRLREELKREAAAYLNLMWEQDLLAQHYTTRRGGGDGWI